MPPQMTYGTRPQLLKQARGAFVAVGMGGQVLAAVPSILKCGFNTS